ncbi:MAG: PadR family transcriptional regulator [Pseudomonadota bacterium]
MNTQTLILAILNFDDATGYEIKKQSSEGAFSFFVDISFGSIYPTLSRLEAEGYVTSRSESQSGKPDKKIYAITDAGRAEFIKMLDVVPQRDKFKSEFLLTGMCADLCSQKTIEQAINKQIADTQDILDMIIDRGQSCDHAATQWVTSFGLHVKQATLEYLKNNRESLIALAGDQQVVKDAAE